MNYEADKIDMKHFYAKCAKHGLKITPQRELLYKELIKAKDHPSADALYKRAKKKLSNISFDTVYRTLLSFTEIGFISVVEGYGEQKRFEPNIHNHHHFRCTKCHRIYDFENDAYDNISTAKETQKFGRTFKIKVVLEGICFSCEKKGRRLKP
jgi:Fur family peroxide stress response transcriptional regulator